LSDAVGVDVDVAFHFRSEPKSSSKPKTTASDKSVRPTPSDLLYNLLVPETKPFRLTESVKAAG
jgi:hypothetical protein